MKQVVVIQLACSCEPLEQDQTGLYSIRHRYGHGSVQLHDGRWRHLVEQIVQRHDLLPVGLFRASRPDWACRAAMAACAW